MPTSPGVRSPLIRSAIAVGCCIALSSGGTGVAAQVTDGRSAIDALRFEPLDFAQPRPDQHSVAGVPVLMLPAKELPLTTVYLYVRGGYGRFDRDVYAAAMGLPAMLRYGGTESRSPLDVDEAIEHFAFQVTLGTGGGSISASLNTLTSNLGEGIDLWGEMLSNPGFDPAEIESWRVRQLEDVRRRVDDPARLAFSEMNTLLYGDHPVGWEMTPHDLEPARVTAERFRWVHTRLFCRENLTFGVTSDLAWEALEAWFQELALRFPSCEHPLPEPPEPTIRSRPGVFLIEKELEQSVVVLAHATDVRLADSPRYYSALIGNSILGGGGFSSRILGRVRTEEGFAYSATSLWTTPRKHRGIVAATTRTRPESAAEAIEVIVETMNELTTAPPTDREVQTTVDQIINGFVFNFDSPGQIVARTMFYVAQDLPLDWLTRYWRGIQEVTPASILQVFSEELRPEELTILVVGDPSRMRPALDSIGPVTTLDPDRDQVRESRLPNESPRFPR